MKPEKYFLALVNIPTFALDTFEKVYGFTGHWYNQCYVIMKSKSIASANRRAEELRLGKNVFKKDYATTFENKDEYYALELADKYGCIINTHGMAQGHFIDYGIVANIPDLD